jgi:hypothetical protein
LGTEEGDITLDYVMGFGVNALEGPLNGTRIFYDEI